MPCLPSFLARAAACGALVVGTVVPSNAHAQATAPTFIQQGGIGRNNQDPDLIEDQKFNLRDCRENDFFNFALNPVGLGGTNYDVTVWMSRQAGDDCSNPTNQTVATGLCRQVAEIVTNSYNVKVFVRDIASDAWGPWDGGAGPEVCEDRSESEVPRVLHFYYVDPSSNHSLPLDYAVTYDLLGPSPPTSVNAGIGENALIVSYKEPTNAAEVFRYRAYAETVDAPPVDGAGGEGGASEPGQTGNCTSNVLRPGSPVPPGINHRGESNPSSLKVEAKGLTNGVTYAVAVASVDAFYNSGNLSTLACGTPEPVTGFFEAYREAGGGAGGGYCAIGARRSGVAVGALLFAALGLLLRRVRGRAARTSVRGAS